MSVAFLRGCALALCLSSLMPSVSQAEARGRVKHAVTRSEIAQRPNSLVEAERALARGDLEAAVQGFVQADQEERSMATLVRGFEAAVELDAPLLIVQVAERILSRAEVSDEGRTLARKAIARASDRLTQLELVCGERPCSFEVDGASAPEGISYFSPGQHEIRLKEQPDAPVVLRCAARAICRLTLPAQEDTSGALLTAATAPLAPYAVAQASAKDDLHHGPERMPAATAKRPSRGPLAVLVTSSVAAAALVGMASWTGARAVQARNLHGSDDPSAYDAQTVRSLARQTDYLIAGAAVLAGTALVTGVWWVDWDARRRTSLSLDGTASLRATHRF